MSKFTRDVIENSQAIREEMRKLLQEELIEQDKYLRRIQEAATQYKDTNVSFPSTSANDTSEGVIE